MGIKEGALALADELEAFEDGDCEECSLYGQPECKGHLSCMEIMARYAARKMREAVERDGEGATTVSVYDLLPDEDRKAIAWVREHGGLDTAVSRFESGEIASDMLWGKGHGRFWTADDFEEEISKRLMPAGYEWPRFEDGELVRIGDEIDFEKGCGEVNAVKFMRVNRFVIHTYDEDDEPIELHYIPGERVKRPAPKVLDADAAEISVGDEVYGTRDMELMTVVDTDSHECGFKRIKCEKEGDGFWFYCPDELTHKLPVIAADGKPLREGETVWEVETGDGYVVERIYSGTTEPDFPGHTVACRRPDDIVTHMFKPSQLTHARPDSWEKWREDSELSPIDYCVMIGYPPSEEESAELIKNRALVRRAKALAERERSER